MSHLLFSSCECIISLSDKWEQHIFQPSRIGPLRECNSFSYDIAFLISRIGFPLMDSNSNIFFKPVSSLVIWSLVPISGSSKRWLFVDCLESLDFLQQIYCPYYWLQNFDSHHLLLNARNHYCESWIYFLMIFIIFNLLSREQISSSTSQPLNIFSPIPYYLITMDNS